MWRVNKIDATNSEEGSVHRRRESRHNLLPTHSSPAIFFSRCGFFTALVCSTCVFAKRPRCHANNTYLQLVFHVCYQLDAFCLCANNEALVVFWRCCRAPLSYHSLFTSYMRTVRVAVCTTR